jgi:hypothetical protein
VRIASLSRAFALALAFCCGVAHAEYVTYCEVELTAAKAGSASTAEGVTYIMVDTETLGIRLVVEHNVAGANAVEVRHGGAGATGAVITNLGGNTGNNFFYDLTPTEQQELTSAGLDWHILVASPTFASPQGAIRANAEDCGIPLEGEPGGGGDEGEAETDGEEAPEGFKDYTCTINLNAAQVPSGSSSIYTATLDVEISQANYADVLFRLFNVPNVEEVVNGEFSTSAGWTLGSGWDYETLLGGSRRARAQSTSNDLTQANVFTAGLTYEVQYTINVTQGSIQLRAGTATTPPKTLSGSYVEQITADGTTLTFDATNFTGNVDSVSVKLRRPFFRLAIHEGAPGEDGEEVRFLGDQPYPVLLNMWTYAELERYTSTPHYILLSGAEQLEGPYTPLIRGDIVGCPFDDGVEPEGEGEIEAEEGEGEPVDCLVPTDLEIELCSEELTAQAMVPPTTSPYTGTVQILGPFPPDNSYAVVVRHNVPQPTSIDFFIGNPGVVGTPFVSYTSNVECPFQALQSPDFVLLIDENPLYVQVNGSDPNHTIRADMLCVELIEGDPEEEGEGEGTPDGGVDEGEDEGEDPNANLPTFAELLLFRYQQADSSGDDLLDVTEVQFILSQVSTENFEAMDSNNDGSLSTAELHRFAGPVRKHNADVNGDESLSFGELLRLVQLYNAGSFHCNEPAGDTEDGYAPGDGDTSCSPHASDYRNGSADFRIDLSELLRGLQIYTFGDYRWCSAVETSEDRFCLDVN